MKDMVREIVAPQQSGIEIAQEFAREVFMPRLTRVELLTEIGVAVVVGVAIALGCWL